MVSLIKTDTRYWLNWLMMEMMLIPISRRNVLFVKGYYSRRFAQTNESQQKLAIHQLRSNENASWHNINAIYVVLLVENVWIGMGIFIKNKQIEDISVFNDKNKNILNNAELSAQIRNISKCVQALLCIDPDCNVSPRMVPFNNANQDNHNCGFYIVQAGKIWANNVESAVFLGDTLDLNEVEISKYEVMQQRYQFAHKVLTENVNTLNVAVDILQHKLKKIRKIGSAT